MTEKILNKLDVEKNGNESKSFKNNKEFEKINQNYNNQRVKDYSDDYRHSLISQYSSKKIFCSIINNRSTGASPEFKKGNEICKNKSESNSKEFEHDYPFSLTFIILGVFFWLPLLFNIVYIRSPNIHARRIVFASIILAGIYFIAIIFVLVVAGCAFFYYSTH
ncbi:hypothetical protein DDB_G0282635 [Dictyostelium discoideum AX4]|uniref:Transmembrane protein n=1 Tax=Dictyostelium discoideum TaxID=44689 RepID=Q54S73_DICDI|nr:hypothetical protein DDB_G0282635 [Dictyostelium discoideum AX4]EAL66177.1 hypothetical protein DDB_G0282635 [Dictyostelium discoideum AX4]|eukprot:XP_640166.1 hypothetical protein DDB_G0282635 [Dictyostelium discoideum AX4]